MGFLITLMALALPLHPIKTGLGISADTCGLDDVFPPDNLASGPCTPFIIYIPYIIAAILVIKIKRFLIDINNKRWCDHAGVLDDLVLLLFPVWFQVYTSIV